MCELTHVVRIRLIVALEQAATLHSVHPAWPRVASFLQSPDFLLRVMELQGHQVVVRVCCCCCHDTWCHVVCFVFGCCRRDLRSGLTLLYVTQHGNVQAARKLLSSSTHVSWSESHNEPLAGMVRPI